jgi:uncharacterized protein
MKAVIDINHPADVHFFKNLIRYLKGKGHEVQVIATDKDVAFKLLDAYGIDYISLGSYGVSIPEKICRLPVIDLQMLLSCKKFRPDIFLGLGSTRAPIVSFMLGKTSINFLDTEHSLEQMALFLPFVSVISTPTCFTRKFNGKQIWYKGYKELAYLHPDNFLPDPSVLDEQGLHIGDKFSIIRLVSWNASHDIGQHGITDKPGLVRELEKHGKVLISSEGALDERLKKYELRISPDKIHDLLYYASLYVGEGATMACEAAVLGTPSIYISTLKGKLGYLNELENRYGMLFSFNDQGPALKKAIELLMTPDVKNEWHNKKCVLLRDKIDVNRHIIELVERYFRPV